MRIHVLFSLYLVTLALHNVPVYSQHVMAGGYGFQNPINNLAMSRSSLTQGNDGARMVLLQRLKEHMENGQVLNRGDINRIALERQTAKLQAAREYDENLLSRIDNTMAPPSITTKFIKASAVVLFEGYLIPRCEDLIENESTGLIFQRYIAASLCNRMAYGALRKLYALGGKFNLNS